MNKNNLKNKYISEFKNFIGDNYHIGLYWKGRIALYSLLLAAGIKEEDEIILPAFTCAAVSAPILYLKAKPVYVDINPETYNIDPAQIKRHINEKTRIIIVQNTFGLSPDLDPIMSIANEHNLPVIEDCSHGIGSRYKGRLNGTISDMAFFSTQWNKMYSTGIGGISVTRNKDIMEKLEVIEHGAYEPGFWEQMNLKSLVSVKKIVGSGLNYFLLQDVYRFLSRHNLVVGSNQGKEFEEISEPKNYLKRAGKYQFSMGIQGIRNINANIENRKKIASSYHEIFSMMGKRIFRPDTNYEHVYIKFSFLVDDKEYFLRKASEEKIEMSDWFLSPVHPILNNLEQWGYKSGSNPVAEKVARHIINLPTHFDIDEKYIMKISDFLIRNKDRIIHF